MQTRRAVFERMLAELRSSTGVRKAFFENARPLVLNLIFLRLRPEQGDLLTLSADALAAISTETIAIAEVLWRACEKQGFVSNRVDRSGIQVYDQVRHFCSVFCSSADCQQLRGATLALLNAPRAEQQADASPAPQEGSTQ